MKILLTNLWLNHFAGSELVTLELYDYFSKQGHDVEIFTNVVSLEMELHLVEKDVRFFTPASFAISKEYDLVWIHHQTIPLDFFKENPLIGRWVFHHMSPFEPTEFTLNAEIENILSAFVLANSMETAIKLKSLGIEDSKVSLFGNPAPEIFFTVPESKKSNSYFLFISNHPPTEILETMKVLSENGEKVIHIGMGSKWADSRRVTPLDIAGASVVISIGKTIQYSIAMKKNFFIYDRFGGDGFVHSRENFKENAFYNFSGRNSHKRMSAQEIVSQLLNFRSCNPYTLNYIGKDEYQLYDMRARIKSIIHGVELSKKSFFLDKVNPQQIEVLRSTIEIISRFVIFNFGALAERNAILNSVSWRITSPLRKIVQILKWK